ncbi:hypothetical protein L596_001023 [Steinernema carpocapsae]|uniref:Uncharacterized protein n=1 Tax=Steinernema carpocapsae TaxID=34508 RepID=A0A4V6I795_STECR|nr:hypothetical protein L596_001023 [Steinernema carpocapsae]
MALNHCNRGFKRIKNHFVVRSPYNPSNNPAHFEADRSTWAERGNLSAAETIKYPLREVFASGLSFSRSKRRRSSGGSCEDLECKGVGAIILISLQRPHDDDEDEEEKENDDDISRERKCQGTTHAKRAMTFFFSNYGCGPSGFSRRPSLSCAPLCF